MTIECPLSLSTLRHVCEEAYGFWLDSALGN